MQCKSRNNKANRYAYTGGDKQATPQTMEDHALRKGAPQSNRAHGGSQHAPGARSCGIESKENQSIASRATRARCNHSAVNARACCIRICRNSSANKETLFFFAEQTARGNHFGFFDV